MVVPEVSPERRCMLEMFPVVLKGLPTLKGIHKTEAAPYSHPSTELREMSVIGTIAA